MPSVKKKYKFSDSHYAGLYNISSSSVFRYKKEGAPLDNPEKFGLWIAQRSHKPVAMRMPGGLHAHRVTEIRRRVTAGGIPGNKTRGKPDAQDDSPPPERRRTIEGTGLRVEIARQEAECAQAYKRYKEAEEGGSALDAVMYHKIWVAAQKSLRELSKDVPRSEQDDAKVLPIGSVEQSWMAALGEISTLLEAIAVTVSLGLTGVDQDVRLQVEKAITVETDEIKANLQKAPWLK